MPSSRTLITLFLFFFSGNLLFSQSSADNSSTFVAKGILLTEAEDQDWSFYNDGENATYYIDFEKITFNLNEVVVLDDKDEVVFKEEVFDLPVNTIYELDFQSYPTGKYRIELRSYTKFIKKNVEIR